MLFLAWTCGFCLGSFFDGDGVHKEAKAKKVTFDEVEDIFGSFAGRE